MMINVMKAFEEYPRKKIDGLWACWFNNLYVVLWLLMVEMTTNRPIMGGKGAKERPVLRVI